MKTLNENQKTKGTLDFYKFSLFNGLSVALIAESTLILYSLKMGVPDYIIAIMASFLFLGIPFMLLGKKIVANYGASKTLSVCWFFRNVSGLFTVLAPIAVYYSSMKVTGVIIILAGAFGFYAFRGLGMIALLPLLGEITNKKNIGAVNSSGFFKFNIGYCISIIALIILFEFRDSVLTFQAVIISGSALGIISSYFISKIPETETPKISASVSIRQAFKFAGSYRALKILIYSQTIYFIGLALILPYSMLSLKESYKLTDYQAFIYVLVQFLGAVAISFICRKIGGRLNPRKLLALMFLSQITVGVLWIFAGVSFSWFYCSLIFITLGISQFGGYLSLTHYFMNIIPPEKRIGSTMIVSAVSSLTAGLCGAVIGGGLLKALRFFKMTSLDLFHTYFLVILVILLFGFCLFMFMEKITPAKAAVSIKSMFKIKA